MSHAANQVPIDSITSARGSILACYNEHLTRNVAFRIDLVSSTTASTLAPVMVK